MRRLIAFVALLLIAAFAQGRAQSVRGVVLDGATRNPLAGAVVSMLDARDVVASRTTADASGKFRLDRPAGVSGIRVIRIGYLPASLTLSAASHDTTIEVVLTRIPPILAAVRVSDRSLCPGGDERSGAFELWDQVRAGLLAATVAREAQAATATMLIVRRRLAPNDESVRSEQQETHEGRTTKPFTAGADATSLARLGFMREDSTGRVFFGPDEDVLLDESFAATHCFALQQADAAHAGQLGLAFEPTAGRDSLVEVQGTIWLDASPLALRSLDFAYIGLEPAATRARPGGHLDFQTTTGGVAFATAWSLRIPVLAAASGATPTIMLSRMNAGRRARTDWVLSEIALTDAEVLEARWPDGTLVHAEPTGLSGTVTRGDGRPAPFALVMLDGKRDTVVADERGGYLAAPLLAGRYHLTVRDTALAAFVDPRDFSTTAVVQHGTLTQLPIRLSGNADPAAAACRRSTPGGAALFGRVTLPATGDDRPLVRASWLVGDSAVTDRYADVSPDGNFRLCGAALGTPVTLHLRVGARDADTTLTLSQPAVSSFQWRPSLRVASVHATMRTVRGIVTDSANQPVRDVTVAARDHGTVMTNGAGRFRFQLPSTSPVVIDVRRLGFTPVMYSLGAGEDTTIDITLLPAVQTLAAVDVTARRATPAILSGFEDRLSRRRGATTSGTFILQEDIERRHPDLMSTLFTDIPGMRVAYMPPPPGDEHRPPSWRIYGLARAYHYGSLCVPAFYVDGNRVLDSDLNLAVIPDQVRGIEVYSSANAAPPQYQSFNGGCAVVLVWLKR